MNDLKGLQSFQCMFCFMLFSSHSAKNNHISKKHRSEKNKWRQRAVMVPTLSRNKHICLVCGFKARTQEEVADHIELDHEFETRKRFGLVAATRI